MSSGNRRGASRGVGTPPPSGTHLIPTPNPFLGMLPRYMWRKQKDFFAYSAKWLPIAGGASDGATITIEGDADFACIGFQVVTTDAATDGTILANTATLSIKDAGSGRDIFDEKLHLDTIAGTAQNPYYLPFVKVFGANSSIALNLTNLLAATSVNVRFVMSGFKVFNEMLEE